MLDEQRTAREQAEQQAKNEVSRRVALLEYRADRHGGAISSKNGWDLPTSPAGLP